MPQPWQCQVQLRARGRWAFHAACTGQISLRMSRVLETGEEKGQGPQTGGAALDQDWPSPV